jgi:hypothetical protein
MVVAPCSLVEIDRRFRGAYCLRHHAMMEWTNGGEDLWSKNLCVRWIFFLERKLTVLRLAKVVEGCRWVEQRVEF